MIASVLIVALALGALVALATAPWRAVVALPAALATIVVLVEGAGIAPRGAIVAGLIVALLCSIRWRAPRILAAGLLTRGRAAAVRRRRDVLVSRDPGVDPFSTFGELRIKLERRVPELIDNYLDEAATLPAMRRHLLTTELLGEVERLVARAEAADPAALARAERRTALRNHLGSGSDRTPIE